MWYVIHTKTGEEERVVDLLNGYTEGYMEGKCVVPVFEKVIRNARSYRIYLRRLFPGYILVNTEDPKEMIASMRKVPVYTRMLGTKDEDGLTAFVPIGYEDMSFLNTLLTEGVLHVSYVKMKKSRVERVIRPLADYAGSITKLDIQHRRAIVEKDIFGKHRRIYFSLVTDGDPENAWIKSQMESGEEGVIPAQEYDIGLKIGDRVRGINGMYEDNEMTVIRVDSVSRQIVAEIEMFGRMVSVHMFADDVEKV
ncbi:MAG: hypothetical protein IJT16_07740 [Lachnospiraceae bacterium]|nr:hypothetical protein [Lachnospiraceae bacterium]